jgi:hypothetical protein
VICEMKILPSIMMTRSGLGRARVAATLAAACSREFLSLELDFQPMYRRLLPKRSS